MFLLSSFFDDDPDDDLEEEEDFCEEEADLDAGAEEELLPCDTAAWLLCGDVLRDAEVAGAVLAGAEGRLVAGAVTALRPLSFSPKLPLLPPG